MRHLILLRHAKSSWKDRSLPDHDRPLNPRGRRAAPAMGAWLAKKGPIPGAVLCSTARRTRETLVLFTEALGGDVPTTYDRDIYGASVSDLVEVVRETPEGIEVLMLVGHNPETRGLVLHLADGQAEDSAKALRRIRSKYPTGAVARLELDVEDWRNVGAGSAVSVRFKRPKDLPNAGERGL